MTTPKKMKGNYQTEKKKQKIPLVNNEQLGDSSSRKALKVIRAHAVLKGRSSCEVQLGEFPDGSFRMLWGLTNH